MRRRTGISEKTQISVRRRREGNWISIGPIAGNDRIDVGRDSSSRRQRLFPVHNCRYVHKRPRVYIQIRGLHAACPPWIPWAYNFHAHTASSLENTVKMPPSRQHIHVPFGDAHGHAACGVIFTRSRKFHQPSSIIIYIDTSRFHSRVLLRWISCGGEENDFFRLRNNNYPFWILLFLFITIRNRDFMYVYIYMSIMKIIRNSFLAEYF